jgi:hypothetical protein
VKKLRDAVFALSVEGRSSRSYCLLCAAIAVQGNYQTTTTTIIMHILPVEVLDTITSFLNPAEKWRLSATSRRYRNLLPVPLRIKIVSHHSASALAPKFYVSRVVFQDNAAKNIGGSASTDKSDKASSRSRRNNFADSVTTSTKAAFVEGATLQIGEELQWGMDYLFWTYDYTKEQKVFLGRHGQNILYHNLRHNHGILDPQQHIDGVDDDEDDDDHTNLEDDDDNDESMGQDDDNDELSTDSNDDGNMSRPNCLYTLGLQIRTPNQTWRLVPAEPSKSPSPFGTPDYPTILGLSVGGTTQNFSFRPDSNQRMFLSSQMSCKGEMSNEGSGAKEERSLWYCLKESHRFECVATTAEPKPSSLPLQKEEYMSIIPCDPEYGLFLTQIQKPIQQRNLMIHAAPDIMDHGYYLYSPQSLQEAPAVVEVYHAKLDFYFWIRRGYMYFKIVDEHHHGGDDLTKDTNQHETNRSALHQIDFTFAVPILEEDCMDHMEASSTGQQHTRESCRPLKILKERNSSRWWSIKHFMSNAADAKEGRSFVMTEFLTKVKDHDDHIIVHDPNCNMVYIYVKNAAVDTRYPDLPRSNVPWQFLLCG